jgi:hypothetical protein
MQTRSSVSKVLLVFLLVSISGCASTHAPLGWLPSPEQVPMDAYGAWLNIETDSTTLRGEFLALSQDTVFIADTLFHPVPRIGIRSARVVVYDVGGSLEGWVMLGTLSTISNGWYLALTFPMWLIGGPIVVSSRSYDPIVDYPDRPMEEFAAYARYPAGLPHNLDRGAIRMKPRRK